MVNFVFFIGISHAGTLISAILLLFRQKYPKWWFDWNLALTRFCARVTAYIDLLTDEYPSTDENGTE